jgi:hypothetical protein
MGSLKSGTGILLEILKIKTLPSAKLCEKEACEIKHY